MKKQTIRITAYTLLLSLGFQLLYPLRALALTTGPSQPEVQSFEPVGTTEMVNMFTGDFNYNIPLLDVEGYPVNISYHSGISIEQEASWVGLGWNINPGEINRTVRGLPDDFDGEVIEKEVNIKPEKNVRVGTGVNFRMELFGGAMGLGTSYSIYANFNNYKGVGIGGATGTSVNLFNVVNAGVQVGVGSQSGADVDLNASVGYATQNMMNKSSVDIGGGIGFNSRSGLKNLTISGSAMLNNAGMRYNTTIPIGLQNYVPVITNASVLHGSQFQVKLGVEAWYFFPNMFLNAGISTMQYDQNGSRKGFGFLYSEDALKDGSGILDFSRDKDGIYNKSLNNLPAASMTYDIYDISGQGTGGMFRPFRNDIGTVYDPYTANSQEEDDFGVEVGLGSLFEAGADINLYNNENHTGPWKKMNFGKSIPGSLYEKSYFKQAGELTYNQQADVPSLFTDDPVFLAEDTFTLRNQSLKAAGTLPDRKNGTHIYWNNGVIDRSSRANLLTYLTANEASLPEIGQEDKYKGYLRPVCRYQHRFCDEHTSSVVQLSVRRCDQ